MRRPSPLPQPAMPPARTPDVVAPAEEQEDVVFDASTSSKAPDAAITEPIPITRGRDAGSLQTNEAVPPAARPIPIVPPESTGAERSPTAPAEAVGAEGDPGTPVGLRAVWAAARARRKALRAEVRRFTVRQRRRRATWIGVAASIVLLVLATLGAAYSPLFAVERIRVVGTSQLDVDAVEAALDGQLGTPLPLVDDSAVKAALVTFPLVESYTLEARPPHELVVRIVERTPVGYLETRSGYSLVDAAGVVLSTVPAPGPDAPLFTIEGGSGTPAFAAAGAVMRSLPASIRAQVTAVAASTPDDVTLTLGGTNTIVMWGSAEESALKGTVLASAMAARPPATVSEYDVSSPRAVVVR
ncbi:FtsQ-type POTRA domain-containing protein [Microbacterium sp.]|uniref:FtsQ-type POTRA domain-containing protein n=1 Tax=Microbacterium sp. TaxID=51671 RepID=UPI003F6E9A64